MRNDTFVDKLSLFATYEDVHETITQSIKKMITFEYERNIDQTENLNGKLNIN